MNFRQMKILLAVHKNLSFTNAAHELFITQPSVSVAIKEIERELKTNLFIKTGKKLTPTPMANQIVHHSSIILNLYNQMENEMYNSNKDNTITLGISSECNVTHYLNIISSSPLANKISVIVGSSEDLKIKMLNSRINCIITNQELSSDSKRHILIGHESLVPCINHSQAYDETTPILLCTTLLSSIKDSITNNIIEFQSISDIITSINNNLGIGLIPKALSDHYQIIDTDTTISQNIYFSFNPSIKDKIKPLLEIITKSK